jgi:hypothetical protein
LALAHQLKPSIGGIRLELLKQGRVEIVLEAAESDFEPW